MRLTITRIDYDWVKKILLAVEYHVTDSTTVQTLCLGSLHCSFLREDPNKDVPASPTFVHRRQPTLARNLGWIRCLRGLDPGLPPACVLYKNQASGQFMSSPLRQALS